ncbi:MAG: phosphatidate cytidylyltransferase [Bacillota bacterium]|nr:phosphatidate cytidylyltransferase [Bacillota bacterium]
MSGGSGREVAARVLTGVIGIPVLLAVVYAGGRLFQGVLAAIAALMLWEYHRLVAASGQAPRLTLLLGAGLGVGALAAAGREGASAGLLFAAAALEMGLALREAPEVSLLRRGGALILGAVYVGYPLGLMMRLRTASLWWLATGFILVWANDVLAYVVGINLGRRRLAPRVSPKKSIEGAVGGLAAAVVAAVALRSWLGLTPAGAALTGLAVGAAGQVGDLVESALKREAGVKDSGRLLPGHGGLLDRFDSSLLAFPTLYLLLRVLR